MISTLRFLRWLIFAETIIVVLGIFPALLMGSPDHTGSPWQDAFYFHFRFSNDMKLSFVLGLTLRVVYCFRKYHAFHILLCFK